MIASEGKKIIGWIGFPVILILLSAFYFDILILKIVGIIGICFTIFVTYFFRDPHREIPEGDNLILAPADGKIIVKRGVKIDNDENVLVSIFLSVFNVHANRVPVTGIVTHVKYNKGKFLAAYNHKASDLNEQTEIHIQSGEKLVKVKQVAGFLARRILCYLKVGDNVTGGSRLGFILFGSRTDLILPVSAEIWISVGEHVKGGESIIGVLK